MWTSRLVQLIPRQELLPSEEVVPERVAEVISAIADCGFWTDPIRIERSTNVVMDGHHRLAAAERLSLSWIPCAEYTYDEVDVRSRREGYDVNAASIRERALSRAPYPSKTTKHLFPDAPAIRISLEILRGKQHAALDNRWILPLQQAQWHINDTC